MKQITIRVLACLAMFVLFGSWGCSSQANAKSDADLRKDFSQKTFNINNVPPAQRARVEAFIKQAAAMKQGSAHAP